MITNIITIIVSIIIIYFAGPHIPEALIQYFLILRQRVAFSLDLVAKGKKRH